MRRDRDDRGSATIIVLYAGLLTVLLASAFAAAGAAVVARHRAAAAADLAALAGAARAIAGEPAACARAAAIAAANGARLVRCQLDGWDLVVEVIVTLGVPLGGSATASARAGPAYRNDD
jgi:secretion/DNA translocation related TadE-like protein